MTISSIGHIAVCSALIACCVASPALAGPSSTIALRDGSSITGEIVGLRDGVYTIRSAALGTLTIEQSQVATVTNGSPAAPAANQLDAIQQQLTADPDTMRAIMELMEAPEVRATLDDPDVRTALEHGNLDALLSNPRVIGLAADPRFQSITGKLAH